MATVPSPVTWVPGAIPTAAQFNSNIRDAISFYLNPPRALVRNTTVPDLVTNTWTLLTWNTDVTDTEGIHDTGSNTSRLTSQTTGRYHISCNIQWEDFAIGFFDGVRGVQIRKNSAGAVGSGTLVAIDHRHCQTNQAGSVGTGQQGVNGYVFLSPGDYVEAFAYQSDNSNVEVDMTRYNACRFGMVWMYQ